MSETTPHQLKKQMDAAAAKWNEAYSAFCVAVGNLNHIKSDLEEVRDAVNDFTTATMTGKSIDDDDYIDCADMCDELNDYFGTCANGRDLDDVITIIEEINDLED